MTKRTKSPVQYDHIITLLKLMQYGDRATMSLESIGLGVEDWEQAPKSLKVKDAKKLTEMIETGSVHPKSVTVTRSLSVYGGQDTSVTAYAYRIKNGVAGDKDKYACDMARRDEPEPCFECDVFRHRLDGDTCLAREYYDAIHRIKDNVNDKNERK